MNGSKALVLVAIGMLIGAMATAAMLSAWQQRSVLKKGTMALMQYHLGQARRAASTNACDIERIAHHLARIDALAVDGIDVFAAQAPAFATEQRAFARALADARAAENCTTMTNNIKTVADACDACHHNIR